MARNLELGGGRPKVMATVELVHGSLYHVQCEPYETWWWWSSWDKTQIGRVYPWRRKQKTGFRSVARWRSILLDANVRLSDWKRLFTERHTGFKLQVLDEIAASRCLTVEPMQGKELIYEWRLNRIQQAPVQVKRCS
jgi:hypothetical protein